VGQDPPRHGLAAAASAPDSGEGIEVVESGKARSSTPKAGRDSFNCRWIVIAAAREAGAGDEARTRDPYLGKVVLYH
jgi:hypothetical protein